MYMWCGVIDVTEYTCTVCDLRCYSAAGRCLSRACTVHKRLNVSRSSLSPQGSLYPDLHTARGEWRYVVHCTVYKYCCSDSFCIRQMEPHSMQPSLSHFSHLSSALSAFFKLFVQSFCPCSGTQSVLFTCAHAESRYCCFWRRLSVRLSTQNLENCWLEIGRNMPHGER